MLKAEIKKLLSFKFLWIILACMVCLNGYERINNAYSRYYTPKEYTSYLSELNGMTTQEALDYSESKIEGSAQNGYNPTFLWYDVAEICKQLIKYPEYLNGISETAEKMTVVSWWREDTFSYRNIIKTPSAYKELKPEILPLDTSLGVEDFLESDVTDFSVIILLFICVCRIFLHDRETGVMSLLYSTPDGRARLILTKTLVSFICCAFLVAVFYTELFIIESCLYGFGDLSRPIQSVFGYYSCNLPVSAGEYMGLHIVMKLLAHMVFAVIFSFICTIASNNLAVYGFSAGICGICFILYSKISVLSPLNIFHYWNPVQFLHVKEVLGAYTNVNFFGYPISLKVSAAALSVLLLIILPLLNCLIFCKTRRVQYKNISLTNRLCRRRSVHNALYYTFKRALVLKKGFAVLFVLILASLGFSQTVKRYYDNDEIYYENFCTDYAGEINDDTLKFISDKETEYRDIETEIKRLENTDNPGYFKLNELYSRLNDRQAFERFKSRLENVPENAVIFYDTGYRRYFGLDGNKEGGILLLLVMSSLVLILTPVPSEDSKTGMIKILYTTQSGKKYYYKNNLGFSAIIAALVSILVNISYLIQIMSKYGTSGITQPANSIAEFSGLPSFFSVLSAIILLILQRTLFAVLCGVIITLISSKCKGTMSAYCINTVIFVLPVVTFLSGVFM